MMTSKKAHALDVQGQHLNREGGIPRYKTVLDRIFDQRADNCQSCKIIVRRITFDEFQSLRIVHCSTRWLFRPVQLLASRNGKPSGVRLLSSCCRAKCSSNPDHRGCCKVPNRGLARRYHNFWYACDHFDLWLRVLTVRTAKQLSEWNINTHRLYSRMIVELLEYIWFIARATTQTYACH